MHVLVVGTRWTPEIGLYRASGWSGWHEMRDTEMARGPRGQMRSPVSTHLKAKKMANSSEGAAIHVTQNVPFRWISICVATIC